MHFSLPRCPAEKGSFLSPVRELGPVPAMVQLCFALLEGHPANIYLGARPAFRENRVQVNPRTGCTARARGERE